MKLLYLVSLSGLLKGSLGLSDYLKENAAKLLSEDGNRVVRVNRRHLTEKTHSRLQEEFDVDIISHSPEDETLDFHLSPEARRHLENSDVSFEDVTTEWEQHFDSHFNDPEFFCTGEDCASRDLQSFYSSYQTLEAIHSRLDSLAAGSSVAEIDSLGSSYEGRDLKMIWIGQNAKTSNQDLVFYQCNIHAREWLPPMYCTYMAERLLDGSAESNRLLERFSFAIVPSLNPDGYVYSYTTQNLWRKTRKPNPGSTCIGTDGNRNWGDHHCGQGASTSPCSDVYCGVTAFDNPETAAVQSFANTYSSRLFSFADVHSYGGYWMSPWGWTYSLPPAQDYSRMEQCFTAARDAVRAVNGLNFIIGSSANAIYIAAGGSDDWFYSAHGVIYSWSVELRGSSFQPSATNIMPSNQEIFAGMVATLDCAISIEDGGSGTPTSPSAPAPTPFPSAGQCVDNVPSGITVGGVPTPCEQLAQYCAGYDFVRNNCPLTCGECASYKSMAVSAGSHDIPAESIDATIFVVILGVALVLAFAVGVVFIF